jgi:hypothetical protein
VDAETEVDVDIHLGKETLSLAEIVRDIVVYHAVQVVASSFAQHLRRYLQQARSVYCSAAALEATAARNIHCWDSL